RILAACVWLSAACGRPEAQVHAGYADDSGTDGGSGAGFDAGSDAGHAQLQGMGTTLTDAGVTFRLWAPNAQRVELEGDFSGSPVALTGEGQGVWSTSISTAHDGTQYRYFIEADAGRYPRLDPWCRALADATSCRVVDPDAFTWSDGAFRAPT